MSRHVVLVILLYVWAIQLLTYFEPANHHDVSARQSTPSHRLQTHVRQRRLDVVHQLMCGRSRIRF